MRTVCKFVCTGREGNKVTLETQYDNSLPEDQRFCQATPWGKLETIIDNPNVNIEVGKTYYIYIQEELN